MRTQWLENTTPDIEQALARDPIAVLPIGSIEQHGRHVPVGCDTLAASRIAQDSARSLGESPLILVLPPMWYGYSPHHMGFAGTVTLSSATSKNWCRWSGPSPTTRRCGPNT